jgi:hypothetical protein
MIWTSKSGSFADPAKGSHGPPGAVRISKASALILAALIFAIVAQSQEFIFQLVDLGSADVVVAPGNLFQRPPAMFLFRLKFRCIERVADRGPCLVGLLMVFDRGKGRINYRTRRRLT